MTSPVFLRRAGHLTRQAAPLGALILAAALLTACASDGGPIPKGVTEPDKFLFDRGTEELNDKNWLQAREYFRQIVDGYPQSTYRADARIGVGDSFLGEGTIEAYVLAANEFREFLTYYPTHARADYAQYKLGLTHFVQMRSPDRDQTETREAIKEFETFVQRWPTSELLGEVRAKLREAKDRLGESEFRVGKFYYQTRWYPGAIDRFVRLLRDDPEFTSRDAVYFYLAESLIKVDRKAEALPYFERLIREFQTSEFLADAQKRVAELRSQAGLSR